MPQKLSPQKVSKMMALYFDGYSQTDIANRLKLDQSTASLYVSKFESLVDQLGIEAAGKEFGIMHQVEELHSLAVELKKAKLTVEEAKVGLKTEQSLQKLGIKQEDYPDVIAACVKAESEGFLADAVRLSKLEKSTGMTHEQLIAHYSTVHQQLKEEEENLHITTGKLEVDKEELADIEKQKELATEDLEKHMKQVALDTKRLKSVEGLALALKEAGITDKELQDYIKRQQLLNEAGIKLDILTTILEKVKILTSHDHGKGLLQMLNDYGSLSKTIEASQAKVQLLEKQVAGLEQQAALKSKLGAEIAKLEVEKEGLKSDVAELDSRKVELNQEKSELDYATKQKAAITEAITKLEKHREFLLDDIKVREEEVSDFKKQQLERDALLESIAQAQAEANQQKKNREILESFLSFLQSTSPAAVEGFVADLPWLLDAVKQGRYSAESLKRRILNELTGGKLETLSCKRCGVVYFVNKLPKADNRGCPYCGVPYFVEIEKDALEIFKKELLEAKKQQPKVIVQMITPVPKRPEPKDNGKA